MFYSASVYYLSDTLAGMMKFFEDSVMKKVLFVILTLLLNACVVPYPYSRGYGYGTPYYGGTYHPRPYYGGGGYRGWGGGYRGGRGGHH